MSLVRIACIVEGQGEVAAVNRLIARIVLHRCGVSLVPQQPFQIKRTRVKEEGQIERAVEAQARKYPDSAILIMIDSDDDCPMELGQSLLERAQMTRPDRAIGIVCPTIEYETWLIASIESILPNVQSPDKVEQIRGTKEWLKRTGLPYKPTVDHCC